MKGCISVKKVIIERRNHVGVVGRKCSSRDQIEKLKIVVPNL
jgi:hypothetical protein